MSYHEATIHDREKLKSEQFFIDWNSQPSGFKEYPKFFRRFKIENLKDSDFYRYFGSINHEINYGATKYTLRYIPSAGALYPSELYFQIRDDSVLNDGIYHFEPKSNSLVSIYALSDDGVEPFLNLPKVKGIVFLVSSNYFRSSWKYRFRSFRYCLLDAGHQICAVDFSSKLYNREFKYLFDFDKERLNLTFGFFKTEFFLVAGYSGELEETKVKPLRENLPTVLATDYFIEKPEIYLAYQKTLEPKSDKNSSLVTKNSIDKIKLKNAIETRRSIRAFYKKSISKEAFYKIFERVKLSLDSDLIEEIDIFTIIHRVDGLESGIYENGELKREGDFRAKAKSLALEQDLASDCSALFIFTSKAKNYQVGTILAGVLGHKLYIYSNYEDIFCSGIGAYYDRETQEFLETKEDILYFVAIGI